MARMADANTEQGAAPDHVDLGKADLQQRAAVTLIIEVLDMIAPQLVGVPRTLPLAALTLRAYAELLERGDGLIKTDPTLAALAEIVKWAEAQEGKR
jgi:hypothetical protein